jgi:hypothetical protein
MTLVLLLAAAGWWRLVATPRRLGRAFAIFAPVLLLYVAIFVGHEGHYSRYLTAIWLFLPVLTLLGVRQAVALAGNEQVEMEEAERTAARKRRIGVSLALGVLLGAGFLPQMFHWVVWQQRTVEHLRRVHREMVEHVERHVPAGERVGAYDLGLLAWEGERTVVDLAGLTDREMARALYLRRVPELLAERDVRFVVLPERRFNRPSDVQKRMSLAVQMGFEPSRLLRHEIMRITLPMWDKLGVGHMAATQVALAQLTLYELPPQKGTPSSDEVASLAVQP